MGAAANAVDGLKRMLVDTRQKFSEEKQLADSLAAQLDAEKAKGADLQAQLDAANAERYDTADKAAIADATITIAAG